MTQKKKVKILNIAKKGKNFIVSYEEGEKVSDLKIDEEQLVNYRILKDKEFTKTEWNKIKKEAATLQSYQKVLNYLSYKPRSYGEIRKYLTDLRTAEKEIEQIIKRLEKAGLLDDLSLARKYLESYQLNNKGPLYIEFQLKSKAIDEDIIKNILSDYPQAEQSRIIADVINKEQGRLFTYPIRRQKDLIMQKLLRDGFAFSIIKKGMDDAIWESEHFDRFAKEFKKLLNQENDKNKLIQKLMARGYAYSEIKTMMESIED